MTYIYFTLAQVVFQHNVVTIFDNITILIWKYNFQLLFTTLANIVLFNPKHLITLVTSYFADYCCIRTKIVKLHLLSGTLRILLS